MTRRFGDRATFAVEVGPEAGSADLRVVDLWVAGRHLTVRDNVAYVPFLRRVLRETAARVRRREVPPCPFPGHSPDAVFRLLESDRTEFREQFWFLRWGEIVDNVSAYAYLDDELVLMVAFVPGADTAQHGTGSASAAPRPAAPPGGGNAAFCARIAAEDFAATVAGAAELLEALGGPAVSRPTGRSGSAG